MPFIRQFSFHIISLCLLVWTCSSSPTPEQVVEIYVSLVNTGAIAEAKKSCTSNAIAYLNALQAVMEAAGDQPDSSAVQIETIICQQNGDQATCAVTVDDGYEVATEQYLLTKQAGNWLVDEIGIDKESSTIYREEIVVPEGNDD